VCNLFWFPDQARKVRELSFEIYKKGSEYAEKRGILIADTKFEFGLLNDSIILSKILELKTKFKNYNIIRKTIKNNYTYKNDSKK